MRSATITTETPRCDIRHGPAGGARKAIASFALICAAIVQQGVLRGDSKTAPDVVLHQSDGSSVRMSDYRGSVVLADFWASWCAPCQTSFPALDSLSREYAGRELKVLAINVDERRRDADAFLTAHPHTMPVFFDPAGTTPAAFGVKGMPTSFLIDRSGAIRFAHMGYSSSVAERYRREIDQLLSEKSNQ